MKSDIIELPYQVVRSNERPLVLVITPLYSRDVDGVRVIDKISKKTKISIKRNTTPMLWIAWEGEGNVAKNTQDCYDYVKRVFSTDFKTLKYIIKIDNDIDASRCMIDKMYQNLERTRAGVGYTYCSFKYEGAVNVEFNAAAFDVKKLLQCNYISSNSMIKIPVLDEVGGFVTDDKYKRLLDWAMWLKLLKHTYLGVPTYDVSFIAKASAESVSAQGSEDYILKHQRVYEDFVKDILKGV
jgi:hypothetical protein